MCVCVRVHANPQLYMRLSVLVTDLVLYMPAVVLFTLRPSRHTRPRTWALRVYYAIMVLLQPALVLIDHGHFQVCTAGLCTLLKLLCVSSGPSSPFL